MSQADETRAERRLRLHIEESGISFLRLHEVIPGTVVPYGFGGGGGGARFSGSNKPNSTTEGEWGFVPWVHGTYSEQDRDDIEEIYGVYPPPPLGRKPTWDEVLQSTRLAALPTARPSHSNYLYFISEAFRATHPESIEYRTDAGAYIGKGIEHMSALLSIAEEATVSGFFLPNVVLRSADRSTLRTIHTQDELRSFLTNATQLQNRYESAKNAALGPYNAAINRMQDTSLTVAERGAAADQLEILAEGLTDSIKAHFAAYDPDALPDDLPTLKAVLLERLEAAAMKRVKELKSVSTQQGVDLPESCSDEGVALVKVAELRKHGFLAIRNADDTIWLKSSGAWAKLADDADEPAAEEHEGAAAPAAALGSDGEHYRQVTGIPNAKATYAASVSAIEAVGVENVPVWLDAEDNPVSSPINASASVVLKAKHPKADIPGVVSAIYSAVQDREGVRVVMRPIADGDGNFDRLQVRITPPDAAGETAELDLTAINICGPTTPLRVKITNAPPPAS